MRVMTMIEKAGQHAPGLWSFGVTVAYVPWIPSGSTYGRWAVLALGAAALLYRARIVPSVGHFLIAGLLAWMTCGFLWTTSAWDTAGELVTWCFLAAAFCVGFDLDEDEVADLWRGVGAGMVVSACFAVTQYFGSSPVWSIYEAGYVGLFLSKNMAADAATLAVIGCFALSRAVFMPAALMSLWLVGGRACVLALICAAMTWAWIKFPARRLEMFGALVTIILCGAVLSYFGLFGRYDDRLEIWALVIRHLSLVGEGLGTFAVAAPGLEYAHNEFLHYAFELGIGSVLLWGIFAYALGSGPVLERCALVAILAQSMVWFPLHAPLPAFLGLVLAGHLCGLRDRGAASERARRMAGSLGLFDDAPIGVGSMLEADHRRLLEDGRRSSDVYAIAGSRAHLSAGSAYKVGS